MESGGVFVYHAMGGEGSGHPGIRRETLEAFCSPDVVHAFGVYRFLTEEGQADKAADEARAAFSRHLAYDNAYDLASDSAIYCTEFLYKILVAVTGNSQCIPLTSVRGMNYVACDNFYYPDRATRLYLHTYED